MDLLAQINIIPPRTPITVVWNKNLPCYDPTCNDQTCKAFTFLPKDLPFAYGSLTTSGQRMPRNDQIVSFRITSFRPWLGPEDSYAFGIPGMEFFATTGECQAETEWQNPAGKLVPSDYTKGCQLPKYLEEMRKYAMISIRIFLITTTKRKMILLMGALRYPSKVSTAPRHGIGTAVPLVSRRVRSTHSSPKCSNLQRDWKSCLPASRQCTRVSIRGRTVWPASCSVGSEIPASPCW